MINELGPSMKRNSISIIAVFLFVSVFGFLALRQRALNRRINHIGGDSKVIQVARSLSAPPPTKLTAGTLNNDYKSPPDVVESQVRARIDSDVEAGLPLVVHVVVALCDNRYQGIVPVPEQLGNGQDARNNLYWGAMYGVRSFLIRRCAWKIAAEPSAASREILDKIVLHKKIPRQGRDVDVYIVAEAWDGKSIMNAIERFFRLAAGHSTEILKVETSGGFKNIHAGGAAHLVVYVGHNGLMDFSLDSLPVRCATARPRSTVVLACRSKAYFREKLKQCRAHPLLLTTGFMAPEAYTLEAIVGSWATGAKPNKVRDRAAAAYHKYQKCGLGGAKRLFSFEP